MIGAVIFAFQIIATVCFIKSRDRAFLSISQPWLNCRFGYQCHYPFLDQPLVLHSPYFLVSLYRAAA